MDIKDSYLHGTIGVVKSINVNADELTYTLADKQGTQVKVTLPQATVTTNGVMSNSDKAKLDNLNIDYFSNIVTYKISLPDNLGRESYILIAKLTSWIDGKNSDYGIVGRIVGYRGGNQQNTSCYNLVAMLSSYVYNNATTYVKQLYVDKHVGYLEALPYVVTYNGENYLALRKQGSGIEIYFEGAVKNVLPQSQWIVLNTPSGQSLPDNMTVLHSPNFTDAHSITTSKYFDGSHTRTLLHSGNYTNYVNTANFPGLNKTGTVTSITVKGENGLSGTGTITTSGTITLSNSGVRSIATGTTNGTISVNTNGTSANVAVKGLGSAAYTDTSLYQKQSTYVNNTNGENNVYKKITITKSDLDGYGVWLHSRKQHYLLNSGASAMSSPLNTFWELGTDYNSSGSSRTISVKMIAPASSSNITLYVLVRAYTYVQVITSGNVSIVDSVDTEYDSITSETTGWIACTPAKWSDTTYSVVSNSANGLAPKVINTNTATVESAYYVLASTNGSATPSWYKLPANAFANDDTKVTQTNTTTSGNYRILLSGNANDTTETTTARKSANLTFNPNTKTLSSTYIYTKGLKGQAESLEDLMKSGLSLSYNRFSKPSFSDETGITVSGNANGVLWVGTHNPESSNTSTIGYGHMLGFVGGAGALYHKIVVNGDTTKAWRQIAYTSSNITGNAASADKLKTARKLWGQNFDGSADVSGSLTGVTSINMDGDIVINDGTNNDRYIKFQYNNTDAFAWRIGYTGSKTGDDNDFIIQTSGANINTTEFSNVLQLKPNKNAIFSASVTANSFKGNLDGTYVNKLTGYAKATAIGSIAASDSLNIALGKLEFKTDFIYNDLFGTDNDDVINKWSEIVNFIDSVKETETDILDTFVTRKTDQTITGQKTFDKTLIATNNFTIKSKAVNQTPRIVFDEYWTSTNPSWKSEIISDYYGKNVCSTDNFTHGLYVKLGRPTFDNFIILNNYGEPIARISKEKGHWFDGTLTTTNTITSPRFVGSLFTQYVTSINNAGCSNINLGWFSLTSSSVQSDTIGFPCTNNANGILWLGTHAHDSDSTKIGYGHQLGFSGNGKIYHRYIASGTFPTTNTWKQLAFIPDIPTKVSQLENDSGFLTQHQSLANYVTLNTAQEITGAKTFTNKVYIKLSDATLKIYEKVGSAGSSNGSETMCLQTCFDKQDPLESNYVTQYPRRAALALQPRGGSVGIGTTSPNQALEVVGNIQMSSTATSITPKIVIDEYYNGTNNWKSEIASDFWGSNVCTIDGFRHGLFITLGRNLTFSNLNVLDGDKAPIARISNVLGHWFKGNLEATGNITANSFVKKDGTSSQFLKADGSVDSNTYLTSRGYIGTTAVQASSASQNLTGIANATLTGNLTLYNSSNGNSPAVIFQRGTTSDAPIDWKIFDNSGGNLLIQGNTASEGFVNVFQFEHPTYGNQILSSVKIVPSTNDTLSLGTSSLKWSNVYATTFTGDLSGNATTALTSAKLSSSTVISDKAFDLSNASWVDTGYTFASLATGTYAVQVTSGTNLVASGIMSVYTNLSDTVGDEIPLHVYGTAGWRPYLRTYQNKLQISSNDTSSTSRTVTIKIAQIL